MVTAAGCGTVVCVKEWQCVCCLISKQHVKNFIEVSNESITNAPFFKEFQFIVGSMY